MERTIVDAFFELHFCLTTVFHSMQLRYSIEAFRVDRPISVKCISHKCNSTDFHFRHDTIAPFPKV